MYTYIICIYKCILIYTHYVYAFYMYMHVTLTMIYDILMDMYRNVYTYISEYDTSINLYEYIQKNLIDAGRWFLIRGSEGHVPTRDILSLIRSDLI
jgi:hypothetical protein